MNNTATEASLPAELWIEVFSNIDSFEQLLQCSMVNKRWKQLSETAISRRDITIITAPEAMAFYSYLSRNPEKAHLIKHLTMLPRDQPPMYFILILPWILTRHLETFSGSMDNTHFLKAMLSETFSGEGLAKIPNLRTIPSAWTYCNMYDTLLHRLRYTLKEITLNFRGVYYDLISDWTALQHLHEFTQLEALTFVSHVHSIRATENILRGCIHLKRLTIHLSTEDPFKYIKDIHQWIDMNTHQCFTLESLKIKFGMTYNPFIVDYLMYKYPRVESIAVEKSNVKEPWGSCPIKSSGTDSFIDILCQISRVPHYTLNCNVLESEVEDLSYRDIYTPIITVSNSSPNRSVSVHTDPLKTRHPSVPYKPMTFLQK
ncbi:hypothetical protein MBANPS3_008353 [Mucor bainieri]